MAWPSAAAAVLLALVAIGNVVVGADGPAVGSATHGDYRLILAVPRTHFRSTDVIDLTTTLTYTGPEPRVTVSGSSVVNYSLRRDDGLVIGPADRGWCRSARERFPSAVDLERNLPFDLPYFKTGGFGPQDEEYEFLMEFFSDLDTLILPPGRWTITAYSEFSRSTDCADPTEHLRADVSIVVVP